MSGTSFPKEPFWVGDLEIDLARRSITRAAEPVDLSATEWRLLDLLLAHQGAPVAATDLLSNVWGPAFTTDEAYLATWIYRLRQKLEPDPHHPSLLITVPGIGYQFAG